MDKLMNYYSDWHRLKRAVAWMLQLKEDLLLSNKGQLDLRTALHKGPLVGECLNKAEMDIIRYHQRRRFQAEISALEKGKQILKGNSPICKLDPMLDRGILI